MFKKILALSYIDNLEKVTKNTILNLENQFFSIFKIQVENIINEEDRIEKIEDRLEVIFPRYNSDDFVLRYEILKKDRKKENIVVYLLDLVLLNDYIINDMKDYAFVSIIPSFFVCREKKGTNHYFNFDISETMLVITEYMDNNILDISTFKLSKSSFVNDEEVEIEDKYSIANSYLVNIEDDIELIFTGNKINLDELDLTNKNYSYFEVESLDFTKYLNFLPNDIKEYKLPQNGNVIYGKMLGSIMAIVKKPNDIDQKKLITSPKLYMDYILTASRMYRYIVGEKIAISSYGEPSRSESHIDTYGRKWLVNYWELPFADSEVISFALPIPGGIFVITRVDSISSIRNGHNHDYAFLSDYVLPSYSGTFAEWKEFLNLSPKDYPIDPILSSMKFSFDSKNIALKAGDYNFVISQKDFAADKDANLDLSLVFFVND